MDRVAVKFNGVGKTYIYNTEVDLILGGTYKIIADDRTSYDNPVLVVAKESDFQKRFIVPADVPIRTITRAKVVKAPPCPDGSIDKIYLNVNKGATVVIWTDGTKTKVKCQDNEPYDYEKGIALCFMKRAFANRSCFNDVFNDQRHWETIDANAGVLTYERIKDNN